jgi:hypothetical protein
VATKSNIDEQSCLIRTCTNAARFRGLCSRCHQATRRAIRDGRTTEAELIERKMLLPAARGRSKRKSPWDLHFDGSRRRQPLAAEE